MLPETNKRLLDWGICATCFLFPIKLTFGYIGLIPLLCYWLFQKRSSLIDQLQELPTSAKYLSVLYVSFAFSAIFGINPWNSFIHFGTLFFFPFTILCFFDLTKNKEALIIRSLFWGVLFACTFQIFEVVTEIDLPLIGTVSQSGQFAIIFFLILYWIKSAPSEKLFSLITFLFLTTLLVMNLKRGPWAGVSVMMFLFLAYKKPKAALLFVLSIVTVSFCFSPIHERLASSLNHFFISGGRSEIWQIGGELAVKYPLGIGFNNSGILRDFSLEIPKNLKHFHSNFLNIAVEGGWISLMMYLGFLFFLAKETLYLLKHKENILHTNALLGCGLFASIVAGTVEYNIGDSAVITIFYIALGLFYRKYFDAVKLN